MKNEKFDHSENNEGGRKHEKGRTMLIVQRSANFKKSRNLSKEVGELISIRVHSAQIDEIG